MSSEACKAYADRMCDFSPAHVDFTLQRQPKIDEASLPSLFEWVQLLQGLLPAETKSGLCVAVPVRRWQ